MKLMGQNMLRLEDGTNDFYKKQQLQEHAMLSGILCEETGQMSGVPQEVIQRAAFILDATTKGIHIDRAREEKITVHDDQYKKVVEKMVWAVLKPGFLALLARSFWYQALSLFLMCYHLQMEIKKIKCIWLGK